MSVPPVLGHYRILERLGAGGMGEVYLAEDSMLGRRIALKILPPELAASSERLQRFESEARAVAALNHPNIVTVHSVEEADGVHFITMELVRGKTLTASIQRMSLREFFGVAVPLAGALSADDRLRGGGRQDRRRSARGCGLRSADRHIPGPRPGHALRALLTYKMSSDRSDRVVEITERYGREEAHEVIRRSREDHSARFS